jgi:hypothetical protein
VSDTAQKLAIFVRGIDDEFYVTEELAGLMAEKGTTTEGSTPTRQHAARHRRNMQHDETNLINVSFNLTV